MTPSQWKKEILKTVSNEFLSIHGHNITNAKSVKRTEQLYIDEVIYKQYMDTNNGYDSSMPFVTGVAIETVHNTVDYYIYKRSIIKKVDETFFKLILDNIKKDSTINKHDIKQYTEQVNSLINQKV